MLDLAVLAIGSAQQGGVVELTLKLARGGGYVNCSLSAWHIAYNTIIAYCKGELSTIQP